MTHTQSRTSKGSSTDVAGCDCGCDCGGHDHPHEPGACCQLTCFERPSYFCGQLLSDADLTLQENYFREKNKLYHRAIDGWGVVCGLRMYCGADCKGTITIGDGYAIDCCGNDLVVCQPKTLDVIAELRTRKWLIEGPEEFHARTSDHRTKYEERTVREEREERERGERGHEEECVHRQCFYIGICYDEQPSDFVTPYSTDCTPGPGQCQPTRIKEGVRFTIYEKLPARPNPLNEIEKRIERCFKVFREGQFSRGLQSIAGEILKVLQCEPDPAGRDRSDDGVQPGAHRLFKELRALFLHQLRICPDQYNCNLEHEVQELHPPERDGRTPREAFTRLLELIQQYVFSCVLAEFAFLCPEPPEACCVVLGAVEVENGRLTRVVNYPRWYLWCFANFFEVLIYTLANEAACGEKGAKASKLDQEYTRGETDRAHSREAGGCCPGIEIDPCEFLTLFQAENRAGEYAARASVQAIRAVQGSLVSSFAFMKPGKVSPSVFKNLSFEEAYSLAGRLGFILDDLGPSAEERVDPFSALLKNVLHSGPASIGTFTESGKDVQGNVTHVATGPTSYLDAPARNTGPAIEGRISNLESQVPSDLAKRLDQLQAEVDTLKRALASKSARRPR